jgi:hypothetical protein
LFDFIIYLKCIQWKEKTYENYSRQNF